MTLRMATCGLMESGASKPSVPVFQTQEEEADTDEVEEKKTEEDESEDGKAKVESKDMCERHKDKITAQHSDDLRRVFIPVRYFDSCVHLFSSHIVERVDGWRYFWDYLLHGSVFC